jgi:Outer membrane lipoprotein carrier protein LolA-like
MDNSFTRNIFECWRERGIEYKHCLKIAYEIYDISTRDSVAKTAQRAVTLEGELVMNAWRMFLGLLPLLGAVLWLTEAQAAPPGTGFTPLKKGQILRGRFEQFRTLKGFGAPLKSSGSFTLAVERGLIWRTEKPFAMMTVMTRNGLIQRSEGGGDTRLPADRIPFMTQLYKMLGGALSGDWEAMATTFAMTRRDTKNGWQVTFTPLQQDSSSVPLQSIVVTGRQNVDDVVLAKPNGDQDRIVFAQPRITSEDLTDEEGALLDAVEAQ